MTAPAPTALLHPREVAAMFAVHERTIRRWEIAGKLTPLPEGPRRYLRSDVEALLRGETTGATS
jgi:DNA-binding transcriptional MerR regulator